MNELERVEWIAWMNNPCTNALFDFMRGEIEKQAKRLLEDIPEEDALQFKEARATIAAYRTALKYPEKQLDYYTSEREGNE
jgi:hypothetical protein